VSGLVESSLFKETKQNKMARTIVIGDIHGALKALVQLLERVGLQSDDTLIFLGDYVDGWSQSAQVIDLLLTLEQGYECIFIRGNHDTWCEEWLAGGEPEQKWLIHGGEQTVKSYANYDQAQKIKHLGFFSRMRNYYVDGQNRLFIHAGFSSMHGPEQEVYSSNYSWDRTLWEMALCMDRRIEKHSALFPKRLTLYREMFIGHTPTVNYGVFTPMQGCNVWNVDTGAAFNGKLSALDADTKDFWQSDTVKDLYPDEKGRNRD
jgi:serine/threonine protein phosphatase 1